MAACRRVQALSLIALIAAAATTASAETVPSASALRVEKVTDGVALRFDTDGVLTARQGELSSTSREPARVYFDIRPLTLRPGAISTPTIDHPLVRKIRLGQHDRDTVRLVLEVAPGSDLGGLARWVSGAVLLSHPRDATKVADLMFEAGDRVDLEAIAAEARAQLHRETEVARSAGDAAKLKVVIDPGHGGRDFGAQGVAGLREKTVNLQTALALEAILVKEGFEVVLTRRDDRYLSLEQRVAKANALDADLLISVHANAHVRSDIHGIETFHVRTGGSRASRLLARQVHGSLVSGLRVRRPDVRDLGVKRARFFVLRNSKMPAVLVETGFVTHASEGRALRRRAYRSAIARGIATGIARFARETHRSAHAHDHSSLAMNQIKP